MDGFALALIAGMLLIVVLILWVALEGLFPHLAASRDWSDATTVSRTRVMRRVIAVTALTLWVIPLFLGLLWP